MEPDSSDATATEPVRVIDKAPSWDDGVTDHGAPGSPSDADHDDQPTASSETATSLHDDAETVRALQDAGITAVTIDAEPSGSGTRAMRGLMDRVPTRFTLAVVLGVAGGLMLAEGTQAMLSAARSLVVNIFVALFLSFGLEPAVKWLAGRGMRRGAATGLVFVGVAAVFIGFFASMLPLIMDQGANLLNNADQIIQGLIDNSASLPGDAGQAVSEALTKFQQDLPGRVPEYAETLTQGALTVGASLVGSVFNLLTIALVTFYMTADAPLMRATLSSRMSPGRQKEFLGIWDVAIDKTGGYVYSRALTLVASAAFHMVVFSLIGLPYAIAMGFWVGVVSSLIPVVGTYLAGILPVIVALSDNPTSVIWVLVALTIYQAAENYLIAPRITAHTLSLHPGVTFVSVLLGANLLGAVGALLAIPVAAIIAALFSASAEAHPKKTDDTEDDPDGGSDDQDESSGHVAKDAPTRRTDA